MLTSTMRVRELYLIVLVYLTECVVEPARILIVVAAPSISHNVIYQPIIRELSLRGHQVVAMMPDPLKDPALTNLTEIDVHDSAYGLWKKLNFLSELGQKKVSGYDQLLQFHETFTRVLEVELSHPGMQVLIKNETEHFDLVISEAPYFPVLYAFKERFNCPFIGIVSMSLMLNGYAAIGSSSHPAYNIDTMQWSGYLTFWKRFDNLLYFIRYKYYFHFVLVPVFNKMVRHFFGDGISSVDDIERSMDLVLVNTNPIFHVTRPNVPAVIEIGGIHRKPRKPLPQNIKTILDNAKAGVVYFSLGSNVHTSAIGKDVTKILVNAFAKLPYTFICKWASPEIKLPKNMVVGSWWPQQDILDHRNVKLFITQGGLQSTEESISSQVPFLGIPFAGDQIHNVNRYITLGIGKRLLVEEITEESLTQAIKEVITNPSYKKNIIKVSGLLWDQPMPPLERAIWWIEYVLRHKGASQLRCPLADMSWVQFLMLDMIGLIVIFFISVILVVNIMIRTIYRQLSRTLLKEKLA